VLLRACGMQARHTNTLLSSAAAELNERLLELVHGDMGTCPFCLPIYTHQLLTI
jgi:hypothetical protein